MITCHFVLTNAGVVVMLLNKTVVSVLLFILSGLKHWHTSTTNFPIGLFESQTVGTLKVS